MPVRWTYIGNSDHAARIWICCASNGIKTTKIQYEPNKWSILNKQISNYNCIGSES